MTARPVLAVLALGAFGVRQVYTDPDHYELGSMIVNVGELGLLLVLGLILVRESFGIRRHARDLLLAGAVLAIGVGLAHSFASVLEVSSAVLVLGLTIAGLTVLGRVPSDERRWLVVVAIVALVPRLIISIAFNAYGSAANGRALAFDDESSFDYAAREVANLVTNPAGRLASEWWHLSGHQLSLLGAVYTLVAPAPIMVRIVGTFLAVGGALLAGLTTRLFFGRVAALVVGVLFGVMPSLVVWSATLLKEPLVTTMILVVLWAIARWRSARQWEMVVLALGAVQVLTTVRLYVGMGLGAVVGAALLVDLVLWARRAPVGLRSAGALGAGVIAIGLLVWLQAPGHLTATSPVQLAYLQTAIQLIPPPYDRLPPDVPVQDRIGGDVGGPIVVVPVGDDGTEKPGLIVARRADQYYIALTRDDIVLVPMSQVRPVSQMDPGQAQRHLIANFGRGLLTVLFAPFSTGISSPVQALAALDTLVWLAILCAALAGLVRSRQPYLLVPLVFTLLMVLALAVIGGNVGNLVRQRAVLGLPGLLIAAAPTLLVGTSWLARMLPANWGLSRPVPAPERRPAL